MLSFAAAVTWNWSATIAPYLKSNDTSVNPLPEVPTKLESSWIVSIVTCGCLVGPLIGGVITTKFGKRKAIWALGIPVFVGHLIIAFASRVWMFLIARFIMGLTLGYSFGLMASYIGDIAEDKNRGLLGSATTVFMSIGGLSVYVIGPFISIRLFSFLNLIPPILLFTLFGLFVPDTPYDLLQKNSVEEAKKSLAFYRGRKLAEIDKEFSQLLDSVNSKNDSEDTKKVKTTEQIKMIFKTKALSKGAKIVATTLVFQGLTGMGAVASYYQTIFDESGGSLESTYSVMIIGVVTLFATTGASQLVERLGRKLLLLIGFTFMGISLFSLGTYFLLKSEGYNTGNISWLPLVSLMVFTIAFNVQGGIPWILLTDVFPSNVMDVCSTGASMIMFSLYFVVTLSFPYLTDALGNYGTFYMFGVCMVCAVVTTTFFIPETKGKSLEDVQKILGR